MQCSVHKAGTLVGCICLRSHRSLQPLPGDSPCCRYLWARLPNGISNDLEFCSQLVQQTGVAISPGRSFGPGGFGFVRFALVQPEAVLREAAARIAGFLQQWKKAGSS